MTVPASVIDGNGHVNNVAYVQWMQDVAILHFEALGGAGMMAEHGAVWGGALPPDRVSASSLPG